MKKQFKIVSIEKQEPDENNKYAQYKLEIMNDAGESYKAYAGVGKWNQAWQAGGVGEAEMEMKESAAGNKYVKLGCPAELKPKNYGGGGADPAQFQQIIVKLNQIIKHLEINDSDQPAPPDTAEQPTLEVNDEVDVSDIPF